MSVFRGISPLFAGVASTGTLGVAVLYSDLNQRRSVWKMAIAGAVGSNKPGEFENHAGACDPIWQGHVEPSKARAINLSLRSVLNRVCRRNSPILERETPCRRRRLVFCAPTRREANPKREYLPKVERRLPCTRCGWAMRGRGGCTMAAKLKPAQK